MKISSIINKRTAIIAPLLVTSMAVGAKQSIKIPVQKTNDEIIVNNKTKENKINKSYAGNLFLGLLAAFCGISVLAGDKKRTDIDQAKLIQLLPEPQKLRLI